MACEDDVLRIACEVQPDQATLVPERREEVTTEGGLDVAGQRERVAAVVAGLREAGISVSLFLDPDPRQIEAAPRWRPTPSSCTPGSIAWPAGRGAGSPA